MERRTIVEEDIDSGYCSRCGQDIDFMQQKQKMRPLELKWDEDNHVSERGMDFYLVEENGHLGWKVSIDGRVEHVSPINYHVTEWINFDIHKWYTDRWHQYINLKAEFGEYDTREWGA